ncbi:MAG: type III-B CRISPR-associated protein Cas10/Cmr2 [Anaerolineales bacterium]
MTQKYYFVCSIGPVQDFIATARTSQDLWFGSWMLSELAKAAAKALKDAGHTLIFPAPEMDLSRPDVDVTNKVVTMLESGTPQQAADAVGAAIEGRRNALRDDSFGRVQGKFNDGLAQTQLEDLTEFYWAAAPVNNDYYDTARKRAEALLAARKNTRDFHQTHGKPGLPKSSLDGWRESVLPKEPEKGSPFGKFKAEKGESLSGIDLLKRWGERTSNIYFESTTDLAAKPFIINLDSQIGQERRVELQKTIYQLLKKYTERGETLGTLFYVDRLAQLIEKEKYPENFRAEFVGLLRENGVKGEPSPYYALLQADGDNMGKTIDAQTEQGQHSKLSQALSDFDKDAKDIIKNQRGIPVYVGGDDVLAYLPLHTALECVVELNTCFEKWVGTKFDFIDDEQKKRPSLSVGLAIAHHLTPLSDVLEQARNAEKAAKKVKDKNGLVISMSKRGGSERLVTGKLPELSGRMETLIGYSRPNKDGKVAISHGAAYELEELQRRLDIPDLDKKALREMLEKEAIRIIGRKRESGGDEKMKEETRQKFEDWFKDENLSLNELAGEMVIAAELAKAYEMANIPLKEETK